MKFSAILLFVVLIAGCAASGHLSTPSGRPEITVVGQPKEVLHACTSWLLRNAYNLGQQTDFGVTGTKDVSSGLVKIMPGCGDFEQIAFSYIDPDSTHVTIYATKAEISKRPETTNTMGNISGTTVVGGGVATTSGSMDGMSMKTGGTTAKFVDSQEDMDSLQVILNQIASTIKH